MTDKVYVVSIDKMTEKGHTKQDLDRLEEKQLEEISTQVLTPQKAIQLIDNELINLDEVCLVYRENVTENIAFNMSYAFDSEDITVNDELVVHIHTNEEGYTVDLYKNLEYPNTDDNNGYLTSAYVDYSELDNEKGVING